MKSSSTIRKQLLERLSELERQRTGDAANRKKPDIVIDMTKVPTISKERWESLGRDARNPAIKLRSLAVFSEG
ncbi:hypothetical protein HNP48_001942 [Acidovorax soli]|uniref:Uncharacterized protein n=1 Tax=Acidovorax soli TaxID=592050 RepID=A0A7X0U983_9BURK|nr:hypothetical protein [Acidovorax soli]MBB6559275.1 hypothetical protein [Acidovorax soli]